MQCGIGTLWRLVRCCCNGDCCVKYTTGKEMRDVQAALGITGKYVRRNMSLPPAAVLGPADVPPDADNDGSEGYNPYEHMPAKISR